MNSLEFWIYYDDPSEPLGVYIGEKKNDGILKHTKVIEFSAFEAEKKDHDNTKQVIEKLLEEREGMINANSNLRETLKIVPLLRQQLHDAGDQYRRANNLEAELEQAKATIAEYPASNRVKNENINLKVENEKLKIKIEQHRGALGYSVSANIPEDRTIKCGLCEAKTRDLLETKTENKELKLQIEAMTYRARNPTAYPSAMDYAESLEREIESLKANALIDPKDLYAESSKKRGW